MNLISNTPADLDAVEIENSCRLQLAARTAANPHYTLEEITKISALKRSLLEQTFELTAEETDNLRALAKFSQTELKPAAQITSHRKVMGRLIVALKRLTWPLIQVHLKDVFAGIREFNSRMLIMQAAQLQELRAMRLNKTTKAE